ncbi:MAG: hypothetical protein MUP36_01345 [Demequinaceae bacterium]|nr:hypothetical protein [Demequinaceae bacterium]
MRTTRLIPLATIAVLVLAACDPGPTVTATAPGTPSAPPSATPIVTPSVTPSITPTVVFGPHPPLADLQITTRGLLPLTHTDPIVGNAGEQMLVWDDDYCYSEVMGVTTDTGRWVANPAYYPSDPTSGAPFHVDTNSDGTVHTIVISSPLISTPSGVHLGTPAADLIAAEPYLVTGTSELSTNVYWIVDAHGFVVFVTSTDHFDGTVGAEAVLFIRILSTEQDPDHSYAQSGYTPEACF